MPKLSEVLVNPQTIWQSLKVAWYDGQMRDLEITSGTALWCRAGLQPLAMRWVLVRDPLAELEAKAYFSTEATPVAPDRAAFYLPAAKGCTNHPALAA